MEVHRTQQFARWTATLIEKAMSGDTYSALVAKHVLDELNYLKALDAEPGEDTATLKRVSQSGKHQVWRVSHPYDPRTAVRLICWFDEDSDTVVVALFANDKAAMGDVFYNSAGSRADQIINEWKAQNQGKRP